MSKPLSEEEAKAEVEDINKEIAKSKGIKIEDKETDPEDPEKDPKEESEEKEPHEDDPEDPEKDPEGEEDLDPKDPEKPDPKESKRGIPVAKYQELKRKSREELEALTNSIKERDAKLADLSAEIDRIKNSKDSGVKIKEIAEKHGVTEEMVADLISLFPKPQVDPEAKKTLDGAAAMLKKQEAEEAFEKEFSALNEELPETAELRDKIRKKAFKAENLDKSLYEIFQRYVKPSLAPAKKKTGEGSRPSGERTTGKAPDFAKIAENLKNNVPNALANLTGEQQDELFDWMKKNGSRYK